MTTFGNNLKAARIEKGISQGNLAELMEIHPTHVSRYERNQTVPSVDVVKKFADILEISTDKLIYGSESEKIKDKIQDEELLNMFSKLQLLGEEERNSVKVMLKAFIFQKEIKRKLAE